MNSPEFAGEFREPYPRDEHAPVISNVEIKAEFS